MGLTERGPDVVPEPGAGAAHGAVLPDWLRSWAGRPGALRLLEQVRDKLERGHHGDRVRVGGDLAVAERADVGRILGRDWELAGRPATLGMLRKAAAQALCAEGSESTGDGGAALEVLLVATGGPLRDLPGERRAAKEEQAAVREQVRGILTSAGVPEVVADLAVQRRWCGTDGTSLVFADQVATLCAALAGGTTGLLAEVATVLFANPHALDRDKALGRTAVRVLAASAAERAGEDAGQAAADGVLSAVRWRQTWADAGVVCDRVSATVLALNVPLTGEAAAAAMSRCAPGEPVWLTARSLDGAWSPGSELELVRVCENPSVAEAAADELGAACPPLVCTYGRPSTAAYVLLAGLHEAGVRLLVTGDRDAPGEQITAALLESLPGAELWCPDLEGLYEEERLVGLLADLRD